MGNTKQKPSGPFVIDVTEKNYSLSLTQNIHWRYPHLQWKYEFETVEELCRFLKTELNVVDNNILVRDKDQDHGTLACTSWYTVIKGYRDTPDCMLY